jgi:hypothetical protein
VPLSCITSQLRSCASFMPAPYSAGLPLSLKMNGPWISLMWMRPSCGLNRAGDLQDATSGLLRVGVGARVGAFHPGKFFACSLTVRMSSWRPKHRVSVACDLLYHFASKCSKESSTAYGRSAQ